MWQRGPGAGALRRFGMIRIWVLKAGESLKPVCIENAYV